MRWPLALAASVAVHVVIAGGLLAYFGAAEVPAGRVSEPVEIGVGTAVGSRRTEVLTRAAPAEPAQAKPESPPSKAVPSAEKPAVAVAATAPGAVSGQGDRLTVSRDGASQTITLADYIRWIRTHNRGPEYPRAARLRGEQGRVVVRAVVARSGKLEATDLENASGLEALDRVALETVRGWTFPPFGSESERITIGIPFRFKLGEP